MSFKAWCLANPTKTYEYMSLENRLHNSHASIDISKQKLADLEAGIPPEWWINRHQTRDLGLFSGLSTRLASFAYVSPGASKEEVEEEQKKQQQRRWEQNALNSKAEELIAIDVAKRTEYQSIEWNTKDIDELESKLENYQVDPVIFEWRRNLDNGEAVEEHLARRLSPLCIPKLGLDSAVDFAESLEELVDGFDALERVLTISFWLKNNTWYARVSDGTHSFTRTIDAYEWHGGHIYAFAYALLDYIEHQWDTLIELAEKNGCD